MDEQKFESCMTKAMEALRQATQLQHRAAELNLKMPNIQAWERAVREFQTAADVCETCVRIAPDPISGAKVRAQKYYCLAMVSGDEAAIFYHDPERRMLDRVVTSTRNASKYIRWAIDNMPWSTVNDEDVKMKTHWERLDFTWCALEQRALAQQHLGRGEFKKAAEEFESAGKLYKQSADKAKEMGDSQFQDTEMGRYHSALRDAYESLSFAHQGTKSEEYIQKAEEEAKIAYSYRPNYYPFGDIYERIRLKKQAIALEQKGHRQMIIGIIISIILTILGSILGVILTKFLGL